MIICVAKTGFATGKFLRLKATVAEKAHSPLMTNLSPRVLVEHSRTNAGTGAVQVGGCGAWPSTFAWRRRVDLPETGLSLLRLRTYDFSGGGISGHRAYQGFGAMLRLR